jgi:hypothetical protein
VAPWSKKEVVAAVKVYFFMLQRELRGQAYNKTEYRNQLIQKLNNRNASAVELKHHTISAVLLALSLPHIKGYKPLDNYQTLLLEVIDEHLQSHPKIVSEMLAYAQRPLSTPIQRDLFFRNIEVLPPARRHPVSAKKRRRVNKISKKFGFVSIESTNRSTVSAGETLVFDFETARLGKEGEQDLARRIKWHPDRETGATPYDIQSYESNGVPRFIKVKTTHCDIRFPFTLSLGELSFSGLNTEHFYIYRVFNLSTSPRLFIINGRIHEALRLVPETFQAKFEL